MTTAGEFSYILTVLTGPNAGAQERLSKRVLRVGASRDADIILDDFTGPDVEISVSRGKLRVRSERDEVRCETGQSATPGKPLFTDMPATLHLDDHIQINLSAALAARPGRRGARFGTVVAAALLIGGAVLGAQQTMGIQIFPDATASVTPLPDPQIAAVKKAAEMVREAPASAPRITSLDAAEALEAAVKGAGLEGLDIVSDMGVLRVSGLYSVAQKGEWQRIRKAYDTKFGHVAPLLISIEEESNAPPLAIASVWLGDTPEVTTRSGEVLMLGQVTETGWRVADIKPSAVYLERGRQRIAIDF